MINLIQWNINGLYNHYEYLQEIIAKFNAQIICIQETNFKEEQTLNLKNFKCYNKNRTDCKAASGGVCILIKNNLYSEPFILSTNIEAIAAKVLINNKMITICNIYLSNRYQINSNQIENLIAELPPNFILLGDFNSHNTIWGSVKTDKRGEIIEEVINNHDIVLLNDLSPTHFNIPTGKTSAIDLTLCSNNIATSVEWQALDLLYGSDHFPILTSFNHTMPNNQPQVNKWKFHKADWVEYKKIINLEINEVNKMISNSILEGNIDINAITTNLCKIIEKAANQSIPKTSGIFKSRKHTPWWNQECEDAIKNSKKAYNRYKKQNTLENQIEFKRLKATAKRIIKENKKSSWIEYLQTMNLQTPIKDVWKKIKSIEGNHFQPITTIIENNHIINKPHEIANTFAETFAANSSDKHYSEEFLKFKNSIPPLANTDNEDNENDLNKKFEIEELKSVLLSSKNSSPGPDSIPNILLKELPDSALKTLLDMYNIIYTKKLFPDIWRKAIVIPIPKPGKNKSDKNNYRPIALTCNMCKILEKMINNRLRQFLDKNNILNNCQSGFRKQRSTTDCLVFLESNICDALAENQHMLTVCLDMMKAYDLLWRYRLLEILRKHKITGNMYHFIQNFLNDRSIQVRINTALSKAVIIQNGVPQGAVISVTLFLLAINDILDYIPSPTRTTIFADDVTIFITGKNLKSSEELMQRTLNSLTKYSASTGFQFSTTKTKAIVFETGRKTNDIPQLYIGEDTINVVTNIKILGLTFDKKLTWALHIENIKKQCTQRLNILKALSAKNWGANQSILTNTFKAIIQSKIDYGCAAYGSANKSTLKKLDIILNNGMRIATGAYRTSPISNILSESNMLPLHLRRKKLTLHYAIKLLHSPENQVYPLIKKTDLQKLYNKPNAKKPFYFRANNYLRNYKIRHTDFLTNHLKNKHCWSNAMESISNNFDESKSTDHRNNLNEYEHIYTDTIEHNNYIGAAATTQNKENILLKLPKWYGHRSSLEILILHTIENIQLNKKTIIHTSSSKLIQSIEKNEPKKSHIENIINLLVQYKKNVSICGCNPPSETKKLLHEATNLACKTEFSNHNFKISEEIGIKIVNKKITNEWNKLWKLQTKTNHLRKIKTSIYQKNPALRFNRRDQIILNRLRIGHTRISHQHLITKENSQTCEKCNTYINVDHILLHCPAYHNERCKYKLSTQLSELLNNEKNCRNVLKFIQAINATNYIL